MWLQILLLWSSIFSAYSNQDHPIMGGGRRSLSSPKIWSKPRNGSWVCGDSIYRAIQCDDDSDYIKIARCYCIYYDVESQGSQFGTCLASCFNPQFGAYFKVRRYSVENASFFNRDMCVETYSESIQYVTHRTGRFCGRCQHNYGLSIYSYQFSACIPCHGNNHLNWVKYMAISLIPLGVFYFLVVALKVNFTSSYLNGVVTSIQIIVSPVNLHSLYAWMSTGTMEGKQLLQGLVACYGPLNLDFFRDIYPPFCLGPDFNALQVISLDYIPAMFPFILIIMTYFMIKLYDKNFFFIVWMWKPFK